MRISDSTTERKMAVKNHPQNSDAGSVSSVKWQASDSGPSGPLPEIGITVDIARLSPHHLQCAVPIDAAFPKPVLESPQETQPVSPPTGRAQREAAFALIRRVLDTGFPS